MRDGLRVLIPRGYERTIGKLLGAPTLDVSGYRLGSYSDLTGGGWMITLDQQRTH